MGLTIAINEQNIERILATNRARGFSIMLGSIVVCVGGGSIDHDPTIILQAVAD
jgi:acetolactate synthase regulatory subunit